MKFRKVRVLVCLGLWIITGQSLAQTPDTGFAEAVPPLRNSVYFELGGNGGYMSFNYERLFYLRSGNALVLRVGGMIIPQEIWAFGLNLRGFMPFEAGMLLGQKKMKLELGAGLTLDQYHTYLISRARGRRFSQDTEFLNFIRIGARWQKAGQPWFFRAGITPIMWTYYNRLEFLGYPWAGISVGHNFGRKQNLK